MQDHEKRAARRATACPIESSGPEWLEAPSRPTAPCTTPEEIPDKYYIPEQGAPAVDLYNYPDPILVGNDEVTKTCRDLGEALWGESVTIPANDYTEPLPWSSLGSLEPHQIRFLREYGSVNILPALETSEGPADLASSLGLSSEQSTRFLAAYLDLKQALNTYADLQARSRLNCVYRSRHMWVYCPHNPQVIEDQCLGLINLKYTAPPVSVPEGYRTSALSQEEADTEARIAGEQLLDCRFVNKDDLTVDCCITLPPDKGGLKFSVIKLSGVSAVQFAAGELSGSSVEEVADRLSYERNVTLQCKCSATDTTPGSVGSSIGDDCSEIIIIRGDDEYCNDETSCSCPPDAEPWTITIPECFTTDFTQAEANAIALTTCQDTIICTWCNDEQVGECEEITITPGIMPKGVVCSEESKADANERAKEEADNASVCGTPCDDGCFCGTFEEALERWAGTSDLDSLSPERLAQLADRIVPCGVTPLPWSCTETAILDRINVARGQGSVSAKEAAEAMTAACLAKSRAASATQSPFCGPDGRTCWEQEEQDFSCPEGYGCMTAEEAASTMEAPQTGGDGPCGFVIESGHEVPQYCFRDMAEDDPPGTCPDGSGCMTLEEASEEFEEPKATSDTPCGATDDELMFCYGEGKEGGGGGGGGDVCPSECQCMTEQEKFVICPDGYEICSFVECLPDPKEVKEGTKAIRFCYKCNSNDSGSKTAIVKDPTSITGYRAWYAEESSDVRFNSVIKVYALEGVTLIPVDVRFQAGCAEGTIVVRSAVGSDWWVGASITDDGNFIRLVSQIDQQVVISLSGLRVGFEMISFAEKTEDEYRRNKEFYDQARL